MMDYRAATDFLLRRITLEEIADRLGMSTQTLKQARLDPSNPGHRSPPPGWKDALASLAEERGAEMWDFAQALRADQLEAPTD